MLRYVLSAAGLASHSRISTSYLAVWVRSVWMVLSTCGVVMGAPAAAHIFTVVSIRVQRWVSGSVGSMGLLMSQSALFPSDGAVVPQVSKRCVRSSDAVRLL